MVQNNDDMKIFGSSITTKADYIDFKAKDVVLDSLRGNILKKKAIAREPKVNHTELHHRKFKRT